MRDVLPGVLIAAVLVAVLAWPSRGTAGSGGAVLLSLQPHTAAVVLSLRPGADRVVLRLSREYAIGPTREAVNERALFGSAPRKPSIEFAMLAMQATETVERVQAALARGAERARMQLAAEKAATVKTRMARLSVAKRKAAAKLRGVKPAPAAPEIEAVQTAEVGAAKGTTRTPMRTGAAFTSHEAPAAAEVEAGSWRLNERVSLTVAPLSTVMPTRPRGSEDDRFETYRGFDDRQAPAGASVGLTFKLN